MNNIAQDKNIYGNSKNWANWMANLDPRTCNDCEDNHGKIFPISILKQLKSRPVKKHPFGHCIYVPMRTKPVGTATNQGENGADFQLYHYNKLPIYYIDKQTAYNAGWKTTEENINKLFPGMSLGGDIYNNDDMKLPSAPERIWREADINYNGSKRRNRQRILYSNDGLMFATYDHYHTFYEITHKETI